MLPWYYRQLLDAGATGACPFYYADGWWKGGEPSKHNDTAEEWFGFWGYRNLEDTIGYPRPVWHALERYNKALISSPRNQMFYKKVVPLEIFFQPDVASIRVIYQDSTVYSKNNITTNYLNDSLSFAGQGLRDCELVFEFYNKNQELVKIENIILLTGDTVIEWPKVTVSTTLKNLEDNHQVAVEINIVNDTVFSLGGVVRYLFSTHIGWSKGERREWKIDPAKKNMNMTDSYAYPENSPLLGLYAGTEITYGKFVKTIYDQKLIYRGTWADSIRLKSP
jgi:hypothetical protein